MLTHHDLDHIGNAFMLQKLTKAKLWASSEDIPFIMGNKERPGIKKIFASIFPVKKPEEIQPYNKDVKIGDIEIIKTPGHVSILYKDVLFAGDLVKCKSGKLIAFPNMNFDEELLRKSIKSITSIPFKWVCPAHGEPVERGNQWETIK